MFRSVLVIIFVIAVLWLGRLLMQRLKSADKPAKPVSKDMVQCLQCQAYIPRDDAILEQGKAFCSQQHLNDWNKPS